MITVTTRGSWDHAENWLRKLLRGDIYAKLDKYGALGVNVLSNATPVDTGETAAAWSYRIKRSSGYYSIEWTNSNINEGRPIAILIQYGHGTGWGGYVQGRDYINPAIRPIFEQMAAEAWKEVTA